MSHKVLRTRRIIVVVVSVIIVSVTIFTSQDSWQQQTVQHLATTQPSGSVAELLATLPIKGRAPKTNYERTQFGDGWVTTNGCDTRNIILHLSLIHI